MTIVHEQPAQPLTLEDRRDALSVWDLSMNDQRKAFARDLHKLKKDWALLYPRASRRQFILWFTQGEHQTRLYAYLDAGEAASRGLDDEGLLFGELTERGKRVLAGETPEEIRTTPPTKAPTTTIRLQRETADALDTVMDALSDADNLTRQEKVERAVGAFVSADEPLQRAMLDASGTGQNLLDALLTEMDRRRDYRAQLRARGCLICGYAGPGIELHHVQAEPDDRYRTHNRLIALCTRHHIARPGDATDAIHARDFADLQGDAEFWRRAFIAVSDAAEATRKDDTT